MGATASQITSLTIVYSIVCYADRRKHQSSATLAFVRGIHRGPVNSPHKWPVTQKMFPFDDVWHRFWIIKKWATRVNTSGGCITIVTWHVLTWRPFLHYWSICDGNPRWPVDSPFKGPHYSDRADYKFYSHCNDDITGAMASHITSLTIVYLTVYSGADHRKHQSSASLAFVRGIHRWPVYSPHKGPVMGKLFPFDYVITIFFFNETV